MKSKKVKIDGIDIEIIKFNPLEGGKLLMRTTAMFSGALKDITSALGKDLSDEEQMEVFMGAIEGLFEKHSPEDVMDYIQDIVASGRVLVKSGKDARKITHFDDLESVAGEDGDGLYLGTMILAESLKYNFSKFLGKFIPALNS